MANVTHMGRVDLHSETPEDRETRDAKLLLSQLRERTSTTSRLLHSWESVPLLLMSDEDWERAPLFVIGQDDYMMWPLLPPGSVLQLDQAVRKISNGRFLEFDRPIYLVEYGNTFYCSYAQRDRDLLILLPHPESPQRSNIRMPFKQARVRGELKLLFRPLVIRSQPIKSQK